MAILTVNRYSNFPNINEMSTPVSSKAVADKIKSYASLFSRSDKIMTDNGAQYLKTQTGSNQLNIKLFLD